MATSVFILAALLLLSLPTATEQGAVIYATTNVACMAACTAAVTGTSSLTAILFPPALFAAVTSTAGCTAACAALAVAGLVTNPL